MRNPQSHTVVFACAFMLIAAASFVGACGSGACGAQNTFVNADPTRASQVINLGAIAVGNFQTVTFDAAKASGQTLTFSTCINGGSFSGDPSICVKDPSGNIVTSELDEGGACGEGVTVTFNVPPNTVGNYAVTVAQPCVGGSVMLSMDVVGHCTASTTFTVARVGTASGNFDDTVDDIANAERADVTCTAFNAMTPSELAAAYQILLIARGTSSTCNFDWDTRLRPYLAAGGFGIYWEASDRLSDLAAIASFDPPPLININLVSTRTTVQDPLTNSLGVSLGLPADRFRDATKTPYSSSWFYSYVANVFSGAETGYFGVVPTGGRIVVSGNPLDTSGALLGNLRRDIINWLYQECDLNMVSGTGFENTPYHFEAETLPFAPCGTLYVDYGDNSLSLINLVDNVLTPDFGSQTVEGFHTYAQDGNYVITVYGCGVHKFNVQIDNIDPAIFRIDAALTVFELTPYLSTVLFTDVGYLDGHTSTIDWGDGQGTFLGVGVDLGATGTFAATHIYTEAGVYDVTWCVNDDHGSTCTTYTITVLGVPPTINIGQKTLSSTVGSTVDLKDAKITFNDAGSGTHTATIDWKDGRGPVPGIVTETGGSGSITGTNVYLDDGVYAVEVCVLDKAQSDSGSAGTCDTVTVTVANTPPLISANDAVVAPTTPFNLAASFSDKGQQVHTGTIDWGDGNTDTAVVVDNYDGSTFTTTGPITGSHTYGANGNYLVEICIDDGSVLTCKTITAYVGTVGLIVQPPVINPSTPVQNQPATVSVDFDDDAPHGPYTATINYGDGTGTNPVPVTITPSGTGVHGDIDTSHTFTAPGDYPVEICITQASPPVTLCQTEIVHVDGVVPVFTIPTPIDGLEGEFIPLTFSFTDAGTGPYVSTVNWGDGSTPDSVNSNSPGAVTFPSHVYADDGVYQGTVCVKSLSTGAEACRDTQFRMTNQEATVSASGGSANDPGAEGVPFTPSGDFSFNDPGTLDTHTAYVIWGDGTTSPATVTETPTGPPGNVAGTTGQVTLPSHYYADDGTYTVQVCVDDGTAVNCRSSIATIADAPAVITSGPIIPPTASEGQLVRLGPITFNDPGTLDTHKICVSWGDGYIDCNTNSTFLTLSENPHGPPGDAGGNDGTATAGHVYADNGDYTIRICIIDQDNISTCEVTSSTITNALPIIPEITVPNGKTVDIPPINFVDLGTLDTHVVTIDYGDGSGTIPAIITQTPFGPPGSTAGNPAIADFPPHTFKTDGIFFPTITFRDDDGGVTTVTLVANTAGSNNPNGDGSDGSCANQAGILMYKEFAISWLPGDPAEVPPGSKAIFRVRDLTSGARSTQFETSADRLHAIWKPHKIAAFRVYELTLETETGYDLWRGQKFCAKVVTLDSKH
eukprot:TRINITY_DN20_c0_g1_i6.p1 TRINITY_DN20_c0_g1~~TRINITY_DN20_c0_g1_i6.p1  ORF type:complete len:1375 (+),score=606.00 TRINITY_DN20_c0_g1_i6:161-4285(+)